MDILMLFINTIFIFLFSNIYLYNYGHNFNLSIIFFLFIFLVINIYPSLLLKKLESDKLSKIRNGYRLLELFIITLVFSIAFLLVNIFIYHISYKILIINSIIIFLSELIIFWNGMLRVYFFSYQLGLRYRTIGLILGAVPVLNIVMLFKIINICRNEVEFENNKLIINKKRKNDEICKTKYPILFVHGVFFRDNELLNYWGRIPSELKVNGAKVFYGNHSSALSVEESAHEIFSRVKEIIEDEGCDKVNIIAHSKGGLDCRYAISNLGMDKYVASLTMINTPNKGCMFADYLFEHTSKSFKRKLADSYNFTMRKLGDKDPDFLSAVKDLTSTNVRDLNSKMKRIDTVYYKSIGSKLEKASGGRFPLNLTNNFVKYFDGANDGLVGEESFKYGDDYTFIEPTSKRGISHADIIDLNRENIEGFDVREFYVQLVSELKDRGF